MDKGKKLPEAFLERMERLLRSEYNDFLASYEGPRHYGLRRNPLKASAQDFPTDMPFTLEPVSWAQEGYYYPAKEQPGKHILHEAGAYYIQEPSAMAVVEILDPRPGERILDLCAAPGGKSTQIAGRMKGTGLLVSNEIVPNRSGILSQNIERMGISNCVVCNETPDRMAGFYPCFFDRIVVDAPCSGEGMFRKDETAVAQWSALQVMMCADRQYGILEEAAKMLKPGGVLVYSTCTFAPDENEGVINRFLQNHPEFAIEDIPHDPVFAPGRADWIPDPVPGIEWTMRLWPHRLRGEGHYIARLSKKGIPFSGPNTQPERKSRADGKKIKAQEERIQNFLSDELGLCRDWIKKKGGFLHTFGDQIYLVPGGMPSMEGMKVIRPGLHLGTDKKNRIDPSHALALTLNIEETDQIMELTEYEAEKYLHGESLSCAAKKGWTLLYYHGYPVGFGKASNGQMKNHYPKGLRRLS